MQRKESPTLYDEAIKSGEETLLCPECGSTDKKNRKQKGKQNHICDDWSVYPGLIAEGDQIMSKTYMIRVEGENTHLRHYLARLHRRKTLCYSKPVAMLAHSIRLLLHYLKF